MFNAQNIKNVKELSYCNFIWMLLSFAFTIGISNNITIYQCLIEVCHINKNMFSHKQDAHLCLIA